MMCLISSFHMNSAVVPKPGVAEDKNFFIYSCTGVQLEGAKGAKTAFQISAKFCAFVAALSILK